MRKVLWHLEKYDEGSVHKGLLYIMGHGIHGTGIFAYIYHKIQPFMKVDPVGIGSCTIFLKQISI